MRNAALIAVALTALLAASAHAELAVGDAPKPIGEDATLLNCEEFDFVKMRGKVVVLQLAHTTSKPSKKQIPKLKELLKKYAAKGLHLITAFQEPKEAVEAFVKENAVDYPVAAGVNDLQERWGLVKGFPTSYVLDVEGNVAWAGNFADLAEKEIVVLLERVTDIPWLPEQYKAMTAHMLAAEFAELRTKLDAALAVKDVPEDEKSRLTAAAQWLDGKAAEALAAAHAIDAKKKPYDAYKAFVAVIRLHPRSGAVDDALAAKEALLEDKDSAREIEAWQFFDQQFDEAKKIESESKRKAINLLKKVTVKYRGTAAAAKANYWISKLSP